MTIIKIKEKLLFIVFICLGFSAISQIPTSMKDSIKTIERGTNKVESLLFANEVKYDTTLLCEIYKIDSINNYYLIYAKSKKNHYKIVSRKEVNGNCDRIGLNNEYTLSLSSIWIPIPEVSCLYFDRNTGICIEDKDSIYALYKACNIKGLHLIENNLNIQTKKLP